MALGSKDSRLAVLERPWSRLCRMPFAPLGPRDLAWVRTTLAHGHALAERPWLELSRAILEWSSQFDVGLEEIARESHLGEFDIIVEA